MSFIIIAGTPDLLDANQLKINHIDLVFNPAKNLYVSNLCYLDPDLQQIGSDNYDYLNLSLVIDDKNKSYLSFIDMVTGSAHFNLTWAKVSNLGGFMFSFILSSTVKSPYPYIHIWCNADTYTTGADTTDSHTHFYSLNFIP